MPFQGPSSGRTVAPVAPVTSSAARPRFKMRTSWPWASVGFVLTPRKRIKTVRKAQSSTSMVPLMNWSQVVETMPAVTTIKVTTHPTMSTPT